MSAPHEHGGGWRHARDGAAVPSPAMLAVVDAAGRLHEPRGARIALELQLQPLYTSEHNASLAVGLAAIEALLAGEPLEDVMHAAELGIGPTDRRNFAQWLANCLTAYVMAKP